MSIDRAERLKTDLTDKWVIVDANIPELRRFVGLTGKVKTVNMNCRALVEFNGAADIGWYDIEPTYLRIVDAPAPKAAPTEKHEKPAAEKSDKPAPKPAGKSPLEMARAQGATGAAKPAAKSPLEMARAQGAGGATQPAAEAGKKLSPLELARQQGAAKSAAAAPAAEPSTAPVAEESKPAAPTGADGKKLSPLELARMQGAGKK